MRLPYSPGTQVRLVSTYGRREDPITHEPEVFHGGVDLVGNGDKTIYAVVSGTVLQSRRVYDTGNPTSEWGEYISIAGDDGLVHYYCHLSARWVVAGERIEQGQGIGVEGSTGRSTGSHLHYEVRWSVVGDALNPAEILGIPNEEGVYVVEENNKVNERTDSEPQDWSREAVEWAVANGIIFGDGTGNLMLREPCTREQVLVFLHRMYQAMQGG